jgi:hypothetical protein
VIVNAGLPVETTKSAGVAIHRLPPTLRESLAAALKPAFLAATCVSLLVWAIAVIWVKEVPLRKAVDEIAAVEAAAGTPNPGAVD